MKIINIRKFIKLTSCDIITSRSMINYNLSPPLQLIVGESQAVNINLKDKVKKENCY
jgi:hypothetical protein